ncbi:lasso RiPP family leader peptide-containing protein [Streptomyces sp. NBC_00257]|nr:MULTISPECIES: lasso RiPP family leader peptide-containing protein [unclassified Streptomyces]MCX4869830.1 lasso RiPP family leader peptide-containing protein [Streptomyces sp. NBC_00906]MCX4900993.1 lasso RiPP family leader peptide-containing protein [Streptomyces sp. NBC_00892]MCX5426247.1 lasso RiPP family leader peptide-containing protein [Streptomyces sp. NBC_00062]
MNTEIEEYESPEMVEVGEFAEVTMGRPNWGFDWNWTCQSIGCHS